MPYTSSSTSSRPVLSSVFHSDELKLSKKKSRQALSIYNSAMAWPNLFVKLFMFLAASYNHKPSRHQGHSLVSSAPFLRTIIFSSVQFLSSRERSVMVNITGIHSFLDLTAHRYVVFSSSTCAWPPTYSSSPSFVPPTLHHPCPFFLLSTSISFPSSSGHYYYYYYYLGIPQQRESFSLIEGVSTDRYKSVEAQLLCMWDGAI